MRRELALCFWFGRTQRSKDIAVTADSKSRTIDIVVNGEARSTEQSSLAALLDELGYGGQHIATAVNGAFVAARRRAETSIAPGDEIEIVAPRQGG